MHLAFVLQFHQDNVVLNVAFGIAEFRIFYRGVLQQSVTSSIDLIWLLVFCTCFVAGVVWSRILLVGSRGGRRGRLQGGQLLWQDWNFAHLYRGVFIFAPWQRLFFDWFFCALLFRYFWQFNLSRLMFERRLAKKIFLLLKSEFRLCLTGCAREPLSRPQLLVAPE